MGIEPTFQFYQNCVLPTGIEPVFSSYEEDVIPLYQDSINQQHEESPQHEDKGKTGIPHLSLAKQSVCLTVK